MLWGLWEPLWRRGWQRGDGQRATQRWQRSRPTTKEPRGERGRFLYPSSLRFLSLPCFRFQEPHFHHSLPCSRFQEQLLSHPLTGSRSQEQPFHHSLPCSRFQKQLRSHPLTGSRSQEQLRFFSDNFPQGPCSCRWLSSFRAIAQSIRQRRFRGWWWADTLGRRGGRARAAMRCGWEVRAMSWRCGQPWRERRGTAGEPVGAMDGRWLGGRWWNLWATRWRGWALCSRYRWGGRVLRPHKVAAAWSRRQRGRHSMLWPLPYTGTTRRGWAWTWDRGGWRRKWAWRSTSTPVHSRAWRGRRVWWRWRRTWAWPTAELSSMWASLCSRPWRAAVRGRGVWLLPWRRGRRGRLCRPMLCRRLSDQTHGLVAALVRDTSTVAGRRTPPWQREPS